MANQHSVSQFLTRPWQRRRDPAHKLVYYNFETDKIEEAKARELFARHDVHSEDIDLRFRNLIEAPLGRLWKRVQKNTATELVTDWNETRAAHLIFLAQPARIVDHSQAAATDDRKLDDLLGMSDGGASQP